jgi:hypothetical protein
METIPPSQQPDWKRIREVYHYYTAFQDIPHIDNLGESPDTHSFPGDYVPKPAADATLAAFAQLATMRLQAQRSMISLIDTEYQYILAEATPRTSLRFDTPTRKNSDIHLGTVRIPRKWGLDEKVLDPAALADDIPDIIIIQDLSQSADHAMRSYVKDDPQQRFYAAVPLKSPNNTIVGSLCVFDSPGRPELTLDDVEYLQDLAVTVMEYMLTYLVRDEQRRSMGRIRGLREFAEGSTTSLSILNEYRQPLGKSAEAHGPTMPVGDGATEDEDACPPASATPPMRETHEQRHTIGDLQDEILPDSLKELFDRASDILRRCNDMDGVLFLDASVANTAFERTCREGSPSRAGWVNTDCKY